MPIHLLMALPAPRPASGSRAIVPDQHASIQAAIDSGVDTVEVRQGRYAERLDINRPLALLGVIPTLTPVPFNRYSMPTVDGLSATATPGGQTGLLTIRNLRVLGHAEVTANPRAWLEGLRIEGGLSVSGSDALVQGNVIVGDCSISSHNFTVGLNTILSGTLNVSAGGTSFVHDNFILGPSNVGIRSGTDVVLRENYVRGCQVGIEMSCDFNSSAIGNVVEDCSGSGMALAGTATCTNLGSIDGNIVRRCQGHGLDFRGAYATLTNNVVEDAGGDGILLGDIAWSATGNIVLRAAGRGLAAGKLLLGAHDNVILHSAGDGIVADALDRISGNVVGRNGGRGIVSDDGLSYYRVRNNTVFDNAGAAFQFGHAFVIPDSITHNIAFGNALGLAWSGPGTPYLACNDWYANTGGAVSGVAVGATDLAVDPKFCDLPNGIVTLAAGSPLANVPGCGPIGALGVGCATAVGVGDPRPASLGKLRIQPQPSRGAMQFAWQADEGATTLEIFDVRGARRMSRALPPRTGSYNWNGADDAGQPLPAGVYFAKLVQSSARSEATVVVIR